MRPTLSRRMRLSQREEGRVVLRLPVKRSAELLHREFLSLNILLDRHTTIHRDPISPYRVTRKACSAREMRGYKVLCVFDDHSENGSHALETRRSSKERMGLTRSLADDHYRRPTSVLSKLQERAQNPTAPSLCSLIPITSSICYNGRCC